MSPQEPGWPASLETYARCSGGSVKRCRPALRPDLSRVPARAEPKSEPMSGTGMIAALEKMASLARWASWEGTSTVEPEVSLATLTNRGPHPTEHSTSKPFDGLALPSFLRLYPLELAGPTSGERRQVQRVGLANRRPRRGSKADRAMRVVNLKCSQSRLPRKRDFRKLQRQAEHDLARARADFGLSRND